METGTLRRRLLAQLTIVALLASLVTVFAASPAVAATITVTSTADNTDDDSECTLREAVESANLNSDVNADCGGGGAAGPDTIVLDGDDYVLDDGPLEITSEITIDGEGATDTVVDGGGTASACDGSTSSDERVFVVDTSGDLTLRELTVQGGVYEEDSTTNAYGGGIYSNGNALTLELVEVRDNIVCTDEGDALGGGIAHLSGTLTITQSAVNSNTAESNGVGDALGGGIYTEGGVSEIVNSTIADNEAEDGGGGVYIDESSNDVTFTYVTIFENDQEGVTVESAFGDAVTFGGTIVANNPNEEDDCEGDSADFFTEGYNLSSDDGCDFDDTDTDLEEEDPELEASLSTNGAETRSHAPEPDSTVVDEIPSADCDDFTLNEGDEDQREEDRPEDGGSRCDIGAIELTEDEQDDTTGGGGGSLGDEMDATPETAVNILPADTSHVVTVTFDEDDLDTDDEDDVNAKIISGPNEDDDSDANYQCQLVSDRCTFTITSNGEEGTDVICVWNDLDGDDDYSASGSSQDGGSCDTETLTPSATNDSDFTDIVHKTWELDETQCDDGDDNDGDGFVDHPADPGCTNPDDDTESPNPTTPPPPPDTECNDGFDNDGDRDTDYPNDEGCVGLDDDTEDSDGPDNVVRRYATLLTIDFGNRNDVFRGQALSQHPRCMRNRIVTLKHVDAGPNTVVGRDSTDRQGDWRVPTFRPNGRYYAVVTRKSFTAGNGDLVVCLRDRSRTVRV